MKPLKNEIRDDCAERFGLRSSDLTFLGGGREDSDGIVYTALKDGVKYVLKISQAADEAHVESILKFAHLFIVYLKYQLLQRAIPKVA